MKVSALSLFLLSAVSSINGDDNLIDSCVPDGEYDSTKDYFPDKFEVDESTQWTIEYGLNYKILKNLAAGTTYLLYQCGTPIPTDLPEEDSITATIAVPAQVGHNGIVFTQATHVPHLEILGLRSDIVGYIGNIDYLSSDCLINMLLDGTVAHVADGSSSDEITAELLTDDTDGTILTEAEDQPIVFADMYESIPELKNQIFISGYFETGNVATFEWHKFYSAFFNKEKQTNQYIEQVNARFECVKQNAEVMVSADADEELKKPTVLWARYYNYAGTEGWDAGKCPNYYCEYASACSSTFLDYTEDKHGSIDNVWGNSLMTLEELLEFGKNADVWIYPGGDWSTYGIANETNKDILSQIKAVQDGEVYDYQGVGSDAWWAERVAEYDVVLQDFCSVVGTSRDVAPIHQRRWFRNVFTEKVGTLPQCQDRNEPFKTTASGCDLLPVADVSVITNDPEKTLGEGETPPGNKAKDNGDGSAASPAFSTNVVLFVASALIALVLM